MYAYLVGKRIETLSVREPTPEPEAVPEVVPEKKGKFGYGLIVAAAVIFSKLKT